MSFLVNQDGYYGEFGGAYIPEILHKCVEELQNTYLNVLQSEDFKQEFDQLLRDYVGRPSPLYYARRLSKKYGCKQSAEAKNSRSGQMQSCCTLSAFSSAPAAKRNNNPCRPSGIT